jgi:SAM-dependent methyltransferase
MYLVLEERTDLFRPPRKRMLHAAPEACLASAFKMSPFIKYVSTNLASNAMVKMDLTRICFPDEIFDVAFVSHVFEHIPDDRGAMREVFRVLKAGGWSILQVPIIDNATFEDPSIDDPEERERIFGHHDHVRAYGEDYYDRLRDVGFAVHREMLAKQSDAAESKRLGLQTSDEVTLCSKA